MSEPKPKTFQSVAELWEDLDPQNRTIFVPKNITVHPDNEKACGRCPYLENALAYFHNRMPKYRCELFNVFLDKGDTIKVVVRGVTYDETLYMRCASCLKGSQVRESK